MRTYLIDGSNAVRRGAYDPRFPEMEELRTERWLLHLCALASPMAGRVRIEVFFDGPRRPIATEYPVSVRFPIDGDADQAILGAARSVLASGKGVIVATGDGSLASELESEGARVIGFGELERRLRDGRA